MTVLPILLYITCCLVTTKACPASSVLLDSTLKQGSLCPDDLYTTFTCTATGTELVWRVGEDMLSYNSNAIEGAFRNGLYKSKAVLMRIEEKENGQADRLSILTVDAQPNATEKLRVVCHNDLNMNYLQLGKIRNFHPKPAVPPAKPEIEYNMLDENSRVINISWTMPAGAPNNEDLSHYAISVDDGPPMLTKNTSILYHLNSGNSKYNFSLRAEDRCGQRGRSATITVNGGSNATITVNGGSNTTITVNGVKKDCNCPPLIILLLIYAVSSTIV